MGTAAMACEGSRNGSAAVAGRSGSGWAWARGPRTAAGPPLLTREPGGLRSWRHGPEGASRVTREWKEAATTPRQLSQGPKPQAALAVSRPQWAPRGPGLACRPHLGSKGQQGLESGLAPDTLP